MKLSSRDVTSCNALWRWFCFNRKCGIGGDGWVHLKGADSMAISGLSFINTLVGSGWATAVRPPIHEWVKKTVLSPCTAPISSGEAFFPVWVSGYWQSAMTTMGSLMGGCALSQKCVEDCCKSSSNFCMSNSQTKSSSLI